MIKNGIVENIAIWDEEDEWFPDCDLHVEITNRVVDIGYFYDGEVFTPPEIEVE